MDIKTLQTRPITTTHACYAHPKLAQARCRVLGSAQRQPRRHVLVSRCSAGETNDAGPPRRDVGRMFQQHKLLMDSGFSYDQASLILEITERRAAPQPADAGIRSEDASRDTLPPAPTAADSSTSIATSSVSAEPTSTDEIQQQQQQQQQQQPGLKGVEDRLSFLELELLKLTLQPADAQQQLLQATASGTAPQPSLPPSPTPAAASSPGFDPRAAAAAGYGSLELWGWPGFNAAAAAAADSSRPDSQPGLGLISQPELLDPEVLAIAEALLIRKGLPYSAAAFAAPPGVAGGQRQFQQQQQQQQQQGRVRTPSSIWGRRRAAQQLRAKPWKYADDPAAAAAAASTQGLMPYGYQPNADASLLRGRRPSSSSSSSGRAVPGGVPGPDGFYGNYPAGYGPGFDFDPRFSPGYTAGFEQGYEQGLMGPEGGQAGDDDDLAPYEPSGWAVAGTVLVVYAGVLLTFFALLAGAGDVGAAVDPADVMLWW